MKKTLIALAVLAVSGFASAQVDVTSTASGGVSTMSSATGVNQASSHAATGSSQNWASGSAAGSTPGFLGPYYTATAGSTAATGGTTSTSAVGFGQGGAMTVASQAGEANAEGNGTAIRPAGTFLGIPFGNGGTVGAVEATSGALVGTSSNATVGGFGIATSGSAASASNTTSAAVNAPTPGNSNATGTTNSPLANNWVTTTGFNFGAGSSVGAGGTLGGGAGSISNGGYSGIITRP